MAKGKIFISKQQSSESSLNRNLPEKNHEEEEGEEGSQIMSSNHKKINKNRDKNMKKKMKKKNKKKHQEISKANTGPTALEMIDEMNEKKYRINDEEEEEQMGDNKNSGMLGKKILFEEKKANIKHVAICFPDSILEIPQTSALRAYFISEVARISSIFKVDQIVVLRDHGYTAKSQNFQPAQYIARNLQYLETPQYLRRHLFKMHPDLKNAGLMNPIQCHHHLKTEDICEFREGVAVERPTKKNAGSWVDIGLKQQAQMDVLVPPGTRVTLRLKDYQNSDVSFYEAEAVSSKTPRQEQGLYWGYSVRIANNIKDLLQPKTPQSYPYTAKILCNANNLVNSLPVLTPSDGTFRQTLLHSLSEEDESILIFFSGTDDLKTLIEKDSKNKLTAEEVTQMFDFSLQFEGFGVKKLRVEEQMWMGLGPLVALRE